MPAVLASGHHDVGQGNVNIWQYSYSQVVDMAIAIGPTLFLNLLVQFYLNNVTDLHQFTSHSTISCLTTWRSYCDHRAV